MSILDFFKKKPQGQKANYITVRPQNYAAAQNSNLTFSWSNYKYTSDQIIKKYFTKLVARSCEQCMNNPYATRYLSLLENNVIGENGIMLQAQAKDNNGTLDTAANEAQEAAWKEWGRAKNCDVTGKLNFIAMQKLILKTVAREGEALVRIVKGANAGNWGFGLQLIDARRLDVNYNKDLNNGHFIRFGIEYNEYGKPLRYHIKKYDEDLYSQTISGGSYYEIPAEEIIHAFIPQYVDQKRGLPWFSTTLLRMNMLNGFEEAAVEHARAGACQMGFITNNDPEAYEDDEELGDLDIEATPASFQVLPAGFDVKKFDPAYPNGEFDTFTKAMLRGVAVGLNSGYSDISGDLSSVNFSSLRQGILDAREVWKGIQEWFKSTVTERIHEEWLKYSLLASKIPCKGGYLRPERIDKYRDVTWTMRRWSWVDPVKDTNAAASAVANGFRSRSDVIREQGRDPEEVWAEVEKENEVIRSKNILVKNEVIKDVGDEDTETETKNK